MRQAVSSRIAAMALLGVCLQAPAAFASEELQQQVVGPHCEVVHDGSILIQSKVTYSSGDDASDVTNKARANTHIPLQLLMTGPLNSLDEFPAETQTNLDNTRAKASGLKLRYMNDKQCRDYIKAHSDDELVRNYDDERHGSFRGDICRSVVLLREGGFYIDLDFEIHVPIQSLVDEKTTLMTVFADRGAFTPLLDDAQLPAPLVLNALIAVKPNSEIMHRLVQRTKEWYAGDRKGLLGPSMMQQVLSETILQSCPQVSFSGRERPGEAECGSDKFRFYQEEFLGDGAECRRRGHVVCPPNREANPFAGVRIGIFSVGEGAHESRLIGWPRYDSCSMLGCGINGGEASL